MSKINPEKYITIQGWMISELNLKGNELLVYAIIYGFSQDDESWFTGSRQYLADWCNCSVRSIQTILNVLVEKDLLIKSENIHNGIKYCSYATNFTGGEKSSLGSEKFSHYNILYNIDSKDNDISKTNKLSAEPEFEFGKDSEKPKKNLYHKCLDIINSYTEDEELRKALIRYLNFILEKYRSEKKTLYENQWKGLIKKLDTIENKVASVEYSIQKGYVGFYPAGNDYVTTLLKNPDTNKAKQHKSNPDDWARNPDGTLMTF